MYTSGMMLMNTNDAETILSASRFTERTEGRSKAMNVLTDESVSLANLKVPAQTTAVFELK